MLTLQTDNKLRGCWPLLLLFVCVCFGRAPSISAADERAQRSIQQATVDPTPARLPVVDGTDIRFRRLSTAGSLSLTKVALIAQDDAGFMWFGTQYGLNRFDGYSFKLFVHDSEKPNSLGGVAVNAIFKDRDGVLWVGCDQSLNRFDRMSETFTQYPVPFTTHISQDTAGVLWLATSSGLYSLDPVSRRVRRYSHDPNDPSSLSSDHVIYSGEDKGGRFWVAIPGCLDEFDRSTGKVTRQISMPDAPLGFAFYEDRFGLFWIYHVSPNALAVFDRNTNTLTHYAFPDRESPGAAVTRVTTMIEDRRGTLWVATHGDGLLKFDRDHRRFIRYRNDPGDPESLPQNNVEGLFADREGNLWAGLGRMGLALFSRRPLPFQRFLHLDAPNNSVQPFVGAIYEDHQEILWIGTTAALNRIDRKTGQSTYYRRTVGPAATTDVVTIREDRSGNLWVGTYGHGLLRFDRRTGHIKTYQHDPADPHSLSSDMIIRLLEDHNGALWAASVDGLNRFDPASERFTTYKLDAKRRSVYLELAEDREGALWLGTDSSGLYHFDPASGSLTIYEHDPNRPGTLSDNRVNSVYLDHSGTMWIGTQNGLNKLDRKDDTFNSYTGKDGLSGNAVGCILEDEHGYLWMSTNNGISRFDPHSGRAKGYSTPDGLPGPDLTGWGACFKNTRGEMFFGGFSGATAFFPDKVVDDSYTPPIVLTDIHLWGNSVEIGSRSPLKQSISYTNELTLSHKQNFLSLKFAALSYGNPATNRYRYKLEDLERDWIEVRSDQREVTYTTLPTGRYTFRAQGATSNGRWSDPGVALKVEILPPWYETKWFQLLFVSVIGIFGWAAYHRHIRRVAARLDARFQERLGERTRVAQDLHDTLLQGFISASMQLNVANRQLPSDWIAKPIVNDVLKLMMHVIEEGRNAIRGMRLSGGDPDDLERAFSRVRRELVVPQASNFQVIVEGRVRPLHPLVRDDVYRIGREALLNAFHHSQAGNIEVELAYKDRELRVIVRDDGCGVDPTVLCSGREGHWGLQGMRERAGRMGAKLRMWSDATNGTEIELSVPSHIAFRLGSSRWWPPWRARSGPSRGGDDVRNQRHTKE
jgi:ligand-binding sensor domain-containing protein/signal transduction histidine kinase